MQLVLSQPSLDQFQLSNHSHKLMLNAQLNYLCLVSFCVRIIRHMHRCLNISYSVFSLLVEQVIAVCAWACFNVSLHFTTGHGDCFPRTGRGSQPSLTPSLQKQCFAALVYHCWSPLIAVAAPHLLHTHINFKQALLKIKFTLTGI